MTRKRYPWDFSCEMPALDYFEKLWEIRHYFYSYGEYRSSFTEDDTSFILKSKMPIEHVRKYMLYLLLGILAYFVACTIHFIVFTISKPTVSDMR